ncbi:hypothetical protein PVK06_016805 [Gossypium arboreum]|uniref:Uncharacterized protein n=1 Tax=Gossypium arboreum TaxID=29729 RepID=A0ABR0Q1G2_GOSAR|nr:hypothetical protein PVK06_016805 [Gossypium arboreum]
MLKKPLHEPLPILNPHLEVSAMKATSFNTLYFPSIITKRTSAQPCPTRIARTLFLKLPQSFQNNPFFRPSANSFASSFSSVSSSSNAFIESTANGTYLGWKKALEIEIDGGGQAKALGFGERGQWSRKGNWVLEGIALVWNPDFAIVDEAYPYIAQRLLTDESPRLRNVLRYTIYGKSAKSGGGENLNGDMDELGLLQRQANISFLRFLPSESQSKQLVQTRVALGFLLSEKGNFFREFLPDEIVKGIDALSREQLVQIMSMLGVRNAAPVFSLVPIVGPFKPVGLLPSITEEDRVILNNVQKFSNSQQREVQYQRRQVRHTGIAFHFCRHF